ncbi:MULTISPECIES: hypothetical protein [unclassified Herbaspirillum]|uniref:hypothetical protein n=1 Tax=unclassified Herbaspirillum TaxID=2624150 RepID=UPI0011522D7D|nr:MULTISPECIES: hypothetical protein [unclassified Herbaspirillum]MBB5393879.1 hypothetical protein [Herbaspirillum sp. SJZ102]TQK00083.1 hypothetical protein FB599_4046 [Herbaspirillum sp. SJZ130]TQK04592.1 hypothetical protein FB598_3913 [Herbaspirillum sp. SJZ106]TWC63165.1 hypothetical protein FB597_11111 [Herbaspirillum sp. SJZ099]
MKPSFPRPLFAALALAGICHTAHADTLASESQIRPLTDKIMAQAGAGRTDDAYAAMSPYALIDIRALEAARVNARSTRMAIEAQVGNSVGYEFIRSEKVGDSLLKLTYIEKTEKQAIPWQFIFYKTPAGWAISAFSNGDNVDALFER